MLTSKFKNSSRSIAIHISHASEILLFLLLLSVMDLDPLHQTVATVL
jgi:hypothetical protein